MASQKRTPATAMTGALEDGHGNDASRDTQPARVGQLVDRYGHVHGEIVLTAWSPQALKALGVRRVGDDPEGGL